MEKRNKGREVRKQKKDEKDNQEVYFVVYQHFSKCRYISAAENVITDAEYIRIWKELIIDYFKEQHWH